MYVRIPEEVWNHIKRCILGNIECMILEEVDKSIFSKCIRDNRSNCIDGNCHECWKEYLNNVGDEIYESEAINDLGYEQ